MRASRDIARFFNFVLDELVPPVLRDSRVLMSPFFRVVFGKNSKTFMDFSLKGSKVTKQEFSKTYAEIMSDGIERKTHLNKRCFEEILKNIQGSTVLDAGCGKGLLAEKLAEQGFMVCALDLVAEKEVKASSVSFVKGNIEKLPFKKNSFSTVVCAHTLEHVQDIMSSVKEMRRVADKRLILVVPKQRPYKYTFDTHLHFFPYPSSFLALMGNKKNYCIEIKGDLFYVEDLK